jgi:hypothetical protein
MCSSESMSSNAYEVIGRASSSFFTQLLSGPFVTPRVQSGTHTIALFIKEPDSVRYVRIDKLIMRSMSYTVMTKVKSGFGISYDMYESSVSIEQFQI